MRLCDYVMFGRVSMVSILSTVSTVSSQVMCPMMNCQQTV